MKRYKGAIRYVKSGRLAWKCDHWHVAEDEAGHCAADAMGEVTTLEILPYELKVPSKKRVAS